MNFKYIIFLNIVSLVFVSHVYNKETFGKLSWGTVAKTCNPNTQNTGRNVSWSPAWATQGGFDYYVAVSWRSAWATRGGFDCYVAVHSLQASVPTVGLILTKMTYIFEVG